MAVISSRPRLGDEKSSFALTALDATLHQSSPDHQASLPLLSSAERSLEEEAFAATSLGNGEQTQEAGVFFEADFEVTQFTVGETF
jgi:hypothetical protein